MINREAVQTAAKAYSVNDLRSLIKHAERQLERAGNSPLAATFPESVNGGTATALIRKSEWDLVPPRTIGCGQTFKLTQELVHLPSGTFLATPPATTPPE